LATKEEKVWTLYLVDANHRNKRDLGVAVDKEDLTQKRWQKSPRITALRIGSPFSPAISQQTQATEKDVNMKNLPFSSSLCLGH